jgi:AmmeMemoRadiSam system protein B/AmmeMemoRadiSam system protein A
MTRSIHILLLLAAWNLLPAALSAQEGKKVNRPPVWAGSFYAGNRQALESQLENLFTRARPAEMEGTVRFIIVPHAGYVYSGVVAASAYRSIPEDAEYDNIFILASAHREYFRGISIYSAGNYLTPLGEVPVNLDIARELIQENASIAFHPSAHAQEHSIEVQLPLIQHRFKECPPIVPILIGSSSVATSRDLALALEPYFVPGNLFVVSSDFSHYPAYQDAVRTDRTTADAIRQNDPEVFYRVLQRNASSGVDGLETSCCGWSSILAALYLSQREEDMEITQILYRNSGDVSAENRDRVVGYWAIAAHQPERNAAFVLDEADKAKLLDITRQTLESYLGSGNIPEIPQAKLSPRLLTPAGAFVSLYKHGVLRGCIGNFLPADPLYKVVQDMAVASATRDTRFYPVDPSELENISVEISVLTPLQKIGSIDEFQLGRHGIYMRKEGKSGTYLPQVAGQTGWSRDEFLGHCARDKAHIGWDGWKDAELFIYEAIVFGEKDSP